MPRSLDKGPSLGKLPPCLICAGPGEGPRAQLHLTHGVAVWLCAAHRAPAFLRKRAGRDFVATLGALWSAAGVTGARRSRALTDHLRRVAQPDAASRERPGSYAWPHLRHEAERRFAAGEQPAAVIAELRARHHENSPAPGPSIRTMRRWFADGRWLGYVVSAAAATARRTAAAASRQAPMSPRPEPAPRPARNENSARPPDHRHRAPPLWT